MQVSIFQGELGLAHAAEAFNGLRERQAVALLERVVYGVQKSIPPGKMGRQPNGDPVQIGYRVNGLPSQKKRRTERT